MLGTLVLDLRVGKGNPYLGYLSLSEKVVYQFYLGSKKGGIGDLLLQSCFRSSPKACTLDIHTYKVLIGVLFG